MTNQVYYKANNGTLCSTLEEVRIINAGLGEGTGSGSGSGIYTGSGISSAPSVDGISELDIAQSHHFTIELAGFTHYRTPKKSFTKFLPVKSINLIHTSYESMTIPLAIFGDFPLLNRKRLTAISLTCFDMDNNKLEKELMAWESQCFPKEKFVAYMEDIARELIYRGYNVKGQQTIERRVYVIPSGGVSVPRDYSANDAKLISFNVIAVGNGVSSASGSGGGINGGDIPIVDHGGGALTEGGSYHTLYASGVYYNGQPIVY